MDIGKGRIEAFSDGVIAIIVTIMVLELKVPQKASLSALADLAPVLLSYVLSFFVVAVMWVNHHHMMHDVRRVNASLLWRNNNLLFWMSLIPFTTAWMGQHYWEAAPVAVYGANLAMAWMAFFILRGEMVRQDRHNPHWVERHRDLQSKAIWSVLLYAGAAAVAILNVYVSEVVYVAIPLLYFLPEKILLDPTHE
jgi:uncharacterized membrane protein